MPLLCHCSYWYPENVGIAVGILLLSCLRTYVFQVYRCHLGCSTSGYLLTSGYHQYNSSGMSLVENVGMTIGNSFPTSVELKIYYNVIRFSYLNLFWAYYVT